MFINNNTTTAANSYILTDAANSIEELHVSADNLALEVILLTSVTANVFWLLLSNGNLYEYDFRTNQSTEVDNSGQICYYEML